MVQGVLIDDGHIVDCNPATGEVLAKIPISSPSEIDAAIRQAQEAQPSWAATPLSERIQRLKEGCQVLSQTADELAELVTKEMGKPISESREEVEGAAEKDELLDLIEEANADELLGYDDDDDDDDDDEESEEGEGSQSLVIRDPLGAVAVLSPWNFPVDEICLLVFPALAAGNAVIVKPSEVTPLVGAKTVAALASTLPPNVLQIVQGDGSVGSKLVESDGVNMVAMTGSTAVGRRIMEKCAPSLKRLVLELGGKDPQIVFADADLDLAAEDAVLNSLSNTGQVCCSIERVYVDEAVKEEFESKVVDIAKTYKVGDGLDEANKVGPLVSRMQRDRVKEQVDVAIGNGAQLLYKSPLPPSASEETTSFYPVTVLGGLSQDMEIQRLETFGPVVSLSTFDGSEEEAVRLANDTEYGLTSSVYTSDLTKATRVARRIRSGQCGINCYSIDAAHAAAPWVGHKASGFGYHSGRDGWRQFSVPKTLVFSGKAPPQK